MPKKYVFDGNVLHGSRPLPPDSQKLISALSHATFDSFYDSKGNRRRVGPNSEFAPNSDHEFLGSKVTLANTYASFKARDLYKELYCNVSLDRAVFVAWDEPKTPKELEAHLLVHLFTRNIFAMGVPTYDIAYVRSAGVDSSIDNFVRACLKLVSALDLTDPFEANYAQEVLRVLSYLKLIGFNPDFSVLYKIECASSLVFVPTDFEFLEAASFNDEFTQRGKPNVIFGGS